MIDKLLGYMADLEFHPTADKIPLDSKVHRFHREGKKNAWFIGFQNSTTKGDPYVVAQFGDWKTGEEHQYTSAVKMSAHDKVAMRESIAKASEKARIEKEKSQKEAAIKAQEFWGTCQDNPSSGYLEKKKLKKLYGAKTTLTEDGGRKLVVPYFDTDGKLWGYQTIDSQGSKRFGAGQKKQGNFFVIPFLDALIDQDTVYIAEGFATAASIHEATGLAVVVAFDCGNMKAAGKALKTKYNDKSFIICADADTRGIEGAEDAATAVLGKSIYPKFEKDREGQTDFNDLALIEGLEAVKNQIMQVKPEKKNVTCLGYQEDVYYFISTEKMVVTGIPKGSFSKLTLLDLMPLDYWISRFPKDKSNSFDLDKASDTLMTTCRKIGFFSPKHVRGTGVWLDHKKVTVNIGDALWDGGEFRNLTETSSRYIYQASIKINAPREDYVTAAELKTLSELLHELSWKSPTYAKLLLGWMTVAPICGALKWRPHVWITGGSGSGKTTVMEEIIGRVLAGNCLRFMGRSTEAGIRQQVGSNALPILFDENENTGGASSQRVGSVVELFRQASSEGDAMVVKGSSGGKAVSFNVRFAAAVSSITVSLTNEQDLNRFAVLELQENRNNGFNDVGGTRDQLIELITPVFSERFLSRSVYRFDIVKQNTKVFYKLLQRRVSARFADQYGILLAGYYAAIQDGPISPQDAAYALENDISLERQAEDTSAKEEVECLNYILCKTVRDGADTATISEIIKRIDIGAEGWTHWRDVLERYGMRRKSNELLIQQKNPEIRSMLTQSQWRDGWSRPLSRIEGSKMGVSVRFNNVIKKCVRIPLESMADQKDMGFSE